MLAETVTRPEGRGAEEASVLYPRSLRGPVGRRERCVHLVPPTPGSSGAAPAQRPPSGDRERSPVVRIGLTSVYVDDQEQARRFYTDVLGLRLKDDVPYGATERWLTVVSPEDPGGPELVLKVADEPARAFQQANR
jgi:hypothetical protein